MNGPSAYPLAASPTMSRTNTDGELRRHVPSLRTNSIERASTAQPRPPAGSRAPTLETLPDDAKPMASVLPANHVRFVLTDIVAARYIEEDPSTNCTVLARRQKIEGYETYLVEQWACSRTHPTFLITTYTGNPADTVLATVISVPAAEAEWSPQMRLYFKSLAEYHARRKETPYGTLMITNLSGFPSSLTVIPIPGGDIKKHREIFFVNENLKRLGCSGRLGINLAPPSSATEAKFHQLYRTSDKIPFNASVIELVKLCQVALVIFDMLEPEYADGLLCDVTEKAINDWWIEFGAEYYTVEPHDGILGPTTVAALLGMLMGARNRLSAVSSTVAKDVFDIESTKRGIAHFQKSQHLPRTRRLDRHTLDKLRRASAKAASKEGWAVPRAFKSTVAELGGKGGEMVMGIVGAGQKDGIAEIETVDIDQFIELVRGEHAKWLWHGKPRKTAFGDIFDRPIGEERSTSPSKHDHSAIKPLRRETTLDQERFSRRQHTNDDIKRIETITADGMEKEEGKDALSKRAAIKAKIESGSGFHHIKNAVSLRTHASKLSRDESFRYGMHRTKGGVKNSASADANGARMSMDLDGIPYNPNELAALSAQRTLNDDDKEPTFTKVLTETPAESTLSLPLNRRTTGHREASGPRNSVAESDISEKPPTIGSSVAGSIYHGIDLNEDLAVEETHEIPPLLRRTLSGDHLDFQPPARNDDWWPRHLSFSIAEESVLRWSPLLISDPNEPTLTTSTSSTTALAAKLASQTLHSEHLKRLHYRLALLSSADAAWVTSRLAQILALEESTDADIDILESIYHPHFDTYHALREDTHTIVSNNRSQLTLSLRDLGNVSDKLEYEISALRGKVEDVEDVLGEFERQVEFVEGRAEELDRVLGQRQGWWGFG
ncbi:hypothetical protein ACN47E_006262 [Coniothyrium glycines]